MAGTPLAPELVDKLLDRLGNDDKFRAVFENDTNAAMKELGAHADFTRCKKPHPLASKEVIRETRAIVRDKLLSLGGQELQCLETR
jgi:putative modified peptide